MAAKEQYDLVHHPYTWCFEACRLTYRGAAFEYQRFTIAAGVPETIDRIMGARPFDAQLVALLKLVNFNVPP